MVFPRGEIEQSWRERDIAFDSQLPTFLWPEAVAHATFLINRSPTCSNFGIPPESSFTGNQVNLQNLRIFGCMAHVHIPDGERQKLDKKSHKCMFMGYDLESKAYRLYDPIRKKIIISRDVIFDEDHVGFQHLKPPSAFNTSSFSSAIPFASTDSSRLIHSNPFININGAPGVTHGPSSPNGAEPPPHDLTFLSPTYSHDDFSAGTRSPLGDNTSSLPKALPRQ
jgi:hypothetical protein